MEDRISQIYPKVVDYYSAALVNYGETARGVDWNSEESQILRFEQVCKIIDLPSNFSINDVGCGYGALLKYLSKRYQQIRYLGCDIAPKMVASAQSIHKKSRNVKFIVSKEPRGIGDYSIASGIFNVKLFFDDRLWMEYIKKNLDDMNRVSRRGFSFNCLSSYSDKEKRKDSLFYANPLEMFDICKRYYSKDVALLHDYGLYEFTMLIRKI